MKTLSLTLLLALPAASCAQSVAGVSASLSLDGAQYVLNTLIPIVEAMIADVSIPDIHTEQDGFNVDITSIGCKNFVIGGGVVTMSEAAGVGVQLTGLNVACTANWAFKLKSWPHFPSGSGSVDGSVSSTTADVSILITANGDIPQVTTTGATLNIGSFNISFHGSVWDILLNLFKELFSGAIKSAITKGFDDAIVQFVNTDANAALAKVAYAIPLRVRAPYNIAEVRFGLAAEPAFNATYMGLRLQGDVVPIAAPVSPPLPAPPLPAFSASAGDSYLQMALGAYTPLSALWTFQQAGLLAWPLSPAELPLGLNTTAAYTLIAPGLPVAFPGAPVAVNVTLPVLPSLTISPAAMAVLAPAQAAFIVAPATGAPTVAFVLDANVSLAVNVSVGPDSAGALALRGTLQYLSASLAVASSAVGTVEVSLLQTFMDVLFGAVVVPAVNIIAANGIALPALDGLTLTNTMVLQQDGFITIASDFTYAPNFTLPLLRQ